MSPSGSEKGEYYHSKTVRGLTWLSRDETYPCKSNRLRRLQGSAIKGYVSYGND
jgi:hypothetical protein